MSERRRVSKVSDDELLIAAAEAANMRQLLQTLGIAAYGGNYESVRRRLDRLGALADRFTGGAGRLVWVEQKLVDAVAASKSAAETFRVLGMPQSGSRHRALMREIGLLGLSTAHWTGQGWAKGLRLGRREPLEQVLVKDRLVGTDQLRRLLLEDGVLPHRCACCGESAWRGQPIPLELDHINGDRYDNRLENLRLLCPNCHAQTDTYRGRNIGNPAARPRAPRTPLHDGFCGRDRLAVIMAGGR